MTDSKPALAAAKEKINELLENARNGSIIPVRLPAQIEEIASLVEAAENEQAEQSASQGSGSPDFDEYQAEEAYFVGHAVHELRTPMTSIRGYTDMLSQMGELNDMQQQFMDVIKTNIKRMQSLLADVSYANKLRNKTLQIQPKMDMVKNVAMRVEKELGDTADELNRTLEVDIPEGLPILNLDSDLLTVALNKLVENGLRYTAAEEGKVTLSASADGDTVVITIADNGIGINDVDKEKLGEIYFRSEVDEVREHKGSGLGVPIAYGLIDAIGGTISLESTEGEGTTWTIRVPGMT